VEAEERKTHIVELAAAARPLEVITTLLNKGRRKVILASSNLAMFQSISQPARQSGQRFLQRIYQATELIEREGLVVEGAWLKACGGHTDREMIKKMIKARLRGQGSREGIQLAKSTTTKLIVKGINGTIGVADNVGRYIREVDKAFPGKHAWKLYEELKKNDAGILSQLRTGANHLNGYLKKINQVESAECGCGRGEETTRHFLFGCTRWNEQREEKKWAVRASFWEVSHLGKRKGGNRI
jgi:hypothetical protein